MDIAHSRASVSITRFVMAVFCVAVLFLSHYFMGGHGMPTRGYSVLGAELQPAMLGYVTIALTVLAFFAHAAGQIRFWCRKDQDVITRRLMCGPLYINAFYLAFIIGVVGLSAL